MEYAFTYCDDAGKVCRALITAAAPEDAEFDFTLCFGARPYLLKSPAEPSRYTLAGWPFLTLQANGNR